MTVSVVRDARFLGHDPGPHHPESVARLKAIDRALEEAAAGGLKLHDLSFGPATRQEILRAHLPAHVEHLERTRGHAAVLDTDTPVSEGSVDAAWLAAGGTLALARGVVAKEVPPGIALVRPPGHHAVPDRAMGFCLVNHVAIAAKALIAEGRAERVAIYDWDVHHGNGTQDIFYADPNVLYVSTHQWPHYPGTGAHDETGRGRGEGATLNAPLPAGTGDAALLEVNDQVLIPRVRDFDPDVILISAGFDPFVDDPLGGFEITAGGFYELAVRWRALAEECCDGRIAAVLEGGYDLGGLAACVRSVLKAWDT